MDDHPEDTDSSPIESALGAASATRSRADVAPELDEVDPEASPALPSATLAAGATLPTAAASERAPHLAARISHDSYADIWGLSWPVMLSQVLVSSVGLIDVAMVGRLGSDAVAAVGYAAQFFFLAQSVLFAVSFACVALMARAIGAGDPERARKALGASVLVSIAMAALIISPISLFPRELLMLLGAEPEIIEITVPYLQLMMVSSALLAVTMILESGMRADKNTRTPMLIVLILTGIKVGLNLLLIFGAFGFPRLEVLGAGIATAIAQAVGFLLFIAVVMRADRGSPIALRHRDLLPERELVKEVVRISLPGVGERLAGNFALLAYFRILSGYGYIAIAAYTVGIRILSFSWIPGTAFGTAAATLVGQSLGAGRVEAASRAGWRATRLTLVIAVILGAAGVILREPLARLFTNQEALVAELVPFLLFLAIAQPFLQSHFTLGGAHRGAGDTWTPFIAAMVGNWVLRTPMAFVCAFVFETSVLWVWAAVVIDHLGRSVWLALSFANPRSRWRR